MVETLAKELAVDTVDSPTQNPGVITPGTFLKTEGDCPACGLGPNTQLFYDDLRPRGPADLDRATVPRERRVPSTAADSHGERTVYHLDAVGHRTRAELQSWTGGGWQTESATDYVYTTRCQLDRIVHADGTVTDFEYDCEGNLTAEWDANHPKDANPPTRSYAYDALSRLTTVTEPWGGGGEDDGPVVVRYGYDVQDHLVEVIDGNGTVTRYQYSDRDLLTQEVSEVSGTTTYRYNEHGALTETVGFVYDDPEVPYSKGRLTAIERELDGPRVEYRYDRFGRMIQDGELAFGYDKNGNRSRIGYPGGVSVSYEHDYADREASLTLRRGAEHPETLATGATYHPTGPLEAVTLGNGLLEQRPYTNRYFHRHLDRPKRADQLRTDPAVVGDDYVVYFAGRPLAQYSVRTSTVPGEEPQESSRVLYLTADHLGTPVLATDESGGVVWRGGFEPFGADYSVRSARIYRRLEKLVSSSRLGEMESATPSETWYRYSRERRLLRSRRHEGSTGISRLCRYWLL